MNWDFTGIISILSLVVSGILAYSYLQIRLGLAEQILQVLNGRYLKKEVADEKFKAMADLEETRHRTLVERCLNLEKRLDRLIPPRSLTPENKEHE